MAERFNVRNVAQKEIYDSYMGILRISPNDGVDDPTEALKDLESDGVILSDSNGTILPIVFKPKVFRQTIYDGSEKPIIHITTNVSQSTFAADNLTVRSTLLIKRNVANDSFSDDADAPYPHKTSVLSIGSGAQLTGGSQYETKPLHVIHYPVEAPHDEGYFNLDNNYNLYDHESDILTHNDQVKAALNAKPLKWYSVENTQIYDHQVKVNGKYISTYNDDGEQIPILLTRDYVLGSYDGHSWKKTSGESDNAYTLNDLSSMANSPFNGIDSFDYVTKLSWLRVDNLIWDALEEILKGDIRHFKGRYSNLGNVKGLIEDGAATNDTSGGSILSTLFNSDRIIDVQQNSPILGQGYQEGLIMYHTMPFHRYWFHRCRQALANFTRRYELSDKRLLRKGLLKDLHEASKYGLITKASAANVTPFHSLVKDFLLCNGLEVNFNNFPNINSTNKNLLKDVYDGRPSLTFGDVDFASKDSEYPDVYSAIFNTNISPCFDYTETNTLKKERKHIVLPNLFSLTDSSPRFIRGIDFINTVEKSSRLFNYVDEENGDTHPKKRYYYYSLEFLQKGEDGKMTLKEILRDDFNNPGIPYQKFYKDGVTPEDEVSLHFYNYDFLTPIKTHTHNLFSTHEGGKGDKDNYDICYYYDYDGNDGGNQYKRWTLKNRINRNLLFNNVNYPGPRWWAPTDKVTVKTDTSSHYNFIKSTSAQKTIKVKGWNAIPWLRLTSQLWLDYCFKENTNQVFYNFTPIPNVGLFLFNGDLYNSKLLKFVLNYLTEGHLNNLQYSTLTDDETKETLKIPTVSNVTSTNYDESDLTGYSASVVATSITSKTTKKVNELWKLRNALLKKLKALFSKGNYQVSNVSQTSNDDIIITELIYINTKTKKTYYYNINDELYCTDSEQYKYDATLEKYYLYLEEKDDDEVVTVDLADNTDEKTQKTYLTDSSIIKIFNGFRDNLEPIRNNIIKITTVKTGLTKNSVDENGNDILDKNENPIKEDILIETPYEGWKTYKWFIDNNFPTKSFSKTTLKKKSDLANVAEYVRSYQSSIISISLGVGCILGGERGTISDLEYLNWEGYSYYDAQNNRHLFKTIDRMDDYDIDSFTDQNEEGRKLIEKFKNDIKKHIELKKKRKMLAMKINESEARIPISYNGKAQFSSRYLYTYERKRSSGSSAAKGDEWDTEQENFKIKDVGNYKIGQFADNETGTLGDKKNPLTTALGKFRCLTSLAHPSPLYLGFGNIDELYDPLKPLTYWNVNNVTDFYKSENSKLDNQKYSTTYGGSKSILVDTKSPYPTHIKLLPLIRL